MNKNDILNDIEDMLEIDKDTLKYDTDLNDIDEWDSMAAVSFIAMADSNYNVSVKPAQLKACKTFGDLVGLIVG